MVNPIRVLIFGATGPSGIQLIRETWRAYPNATIVVYARSPEKLPADISSNENLVIVKGQLTDEEALTKALQGVDVVLSALGPVVPGQPAGNPVATGYGVILPIMKQVGVKRILLLGAASIVDENDRSSIKYQSLIWSLSTFVPKVYSDVVAIGEVIKTQGDGLDWTIVRVPFLTNKDTTATIAGYVGDGKVGMTLSRRAFAAFMVGEIEKREWVHKCPMLTDG